MTRNRRIATWQILGALVLIMTVAVGQAVGSGLSSPPPPAPRSNAQPVIFGQFSGNVLVGLYYINPVTSSVIIVNSGSNVPVDTLQVVTADAGPATNLTFSVEQYIPVVQHETVGGPNNTTVTKAVTVQESVQWDNQTIALTSHAVENFQLQIPQTSSLQTVIISAGGAQWTIGHLTSPAALPAFMTQGGELGLLASAVVLSSLVWAIGILTARFIMDRAKYWPTRSLTGWLVIIFMAAFALYGAAGALYFQLAYIPWYTWLIPLYYISSAFSLGGQRPEVERWELEHHTGSAREDTLETDVRTLLVAPDEEYGYQWISRRSRKAAVMRVLGRKIPVKFINPRVEGGRVVKPWSAENRLCEDPVFDTKRTYWIDPRTDGENVGMRIVEYRPVKGPGEEEGKPLPRKWLRRSPTGRRLKEYAIPLSGAYTQTIPEFVSGLVNAATLGEELERTRWEKEELAAKFDTKYVNFDKQRFGARAAAAGFMRDTENIEGYKRATEHIREQAGVKTGTDKTA